MSSFLTCSGTSRESGKGVAGEIDVFVGGRVTTCTRVSLMYLLAVDDFDRDNMSRDCMFGACEKIRVIGMAVRRPHEGRQRRR
jgi:hypothetical protein